MYIKQNIRNDNDGNDESWLKQLQLEAEEELVPAHQSEQRGAPLPLFWGTVYPNLT